MTTMVKITGTTVTKARACLVAALEHLNTRSSNARDFSLTVSPFYGSPYVEESDSMEPESYSISFIEKGRAK